MFGKLLKYEFKSLKKWYLSLYFIILLLSVMLGFWLKLGLNKNINNHSPLYIDGPIFITAIVIAIAISVGLAISTFFLIVNRFYKSVYGRQGYLTMTLPINSHQILLSKLVFSLILSILSTLVIIISIFIIISLGLPSDAIQAFFKEYGAVTHTSDLLMLVQAILNSLFGIISRTLLAYFAISLGQLFKEHRVLFAIAFYMGISLCWGLVSSFAIMSTPLSQSIYNSNIFDTSIISILIQCLLFPIFYFGTYYILTKKLNLQ